MTAETNTTEFFLAFNEDGNVAGDEYRDEAIERLRDQFGGEHIRVVKMTLNLPKPADIEASMTVPAGASETVEVKV